MTSIIFALAKPLFGLFAGFTFVSAPIAMRKARVAQDHALEARAEVDARLQELKQMQKQQAEEHEHAEDAPAKGEKQKGDR